MDIVLGVSMTPSTVRMVLVDGEGADGASIEHDAFKVEPGEGGPTPNATDHVIAAIQGTREGAVAGGHRLASTGVTWSDRAEAAELREALAARGIDGVTMVSELQAAGALAQAAGGLVGYDKTAVLLIGRQAATLAVVDTADGTVVKVDSRPVTGADAMTVLAGMVARLSEHPSRPDGMFVVGADRDVAAVKERLKALLSMPVTAPADGEMALARGAALAAAHAPDPDAATTALAYSQDPDPTTGARAYTPVLADAVASGGERGRKPFLLVGTSLAAVFMVGVVALVISLAVTIRPTVDSRPNPGAGTASPTMAAPPAPTVENAKPPLPPAAAPAPAPPPAAAPPPAPSALPEIAPAPPVVQQAPRTVMSQQAPVVRPKPAPAAAPAAAPPPPAAAPPPPAEPPPAPPAATPDYPQTGYPPGYSPAPAYGPGYGPVPAYGPAPSYGGPGYGPVPAYEPAPPAPMIPIIPGVLGIGPRPSYRGPVPGYYPPSGPGYGRGGRAPWMWPGD